MRENTCGGGQTEDATWHLSQQGRLIGSQAIERTGSFFPGSTNNNGIHQVVSGLVVVVVFKQLSVTTKQLKTS